MKTIVLFSLALLLVACTSDEPKVQYDFDKDADFSKLRTYKWVPMQGTPIIEQRLDQQIRDATDAELKKKGLARTDADSADLYIGYQAAIDRETQFASYKTDWGYSPSWSGGSRFATVGGVTTVQASTIYTGQLALDMYDSKNHYLVWRGVASKTIDTKAGPDKQKKNLAKAIARLFKNYPPHLPHAAG